MDGVAVEIRSYSGEVTRHLHDFDQIILPCAGALLHKSLEGFISRIQGGSWDA